MKTAAAPARNCGSVAVRIRTGRDCVGQVFFTGSDAERTSGTSSRRFDTTGDDEFHEYVVDMTGLPGREGRLSQLRVDPTVHRDALVDYIHLSP